MSATMRISILWVRWSIMTVSLVRPCYSQHLITELKGFVVCLSGLRAAGKGEYTVYL